MSYSPTKPYKSQSPISSRLELRNTALFHSTNEDWNVLKLNLSWVIGSLSQLFRDSKARYPDYWERFYLRSGEERKKRLLSLSDEKRKILEDFTLPYTNPTLYRKLSQDEKEINIKYGRTLEDLQKVADYFFRHLQNKPSFSSITSSMCRDYVLIRVIDETFIGFQREIKTVSFLKYRFPALTFETVSSEIDTRYAIDVEVYRQNSLLFALQIKSSKYLNSHMNIMNEVKSMNERKNKQYEKEFNVPIYYVYAKADGYIFNREILNTIQSYISLKTH